MCDQMNLPSKASTETKSDVTKPNYVIETWDKPQPSARSRTIRRGFKSGCLVLGIVLTCVVVIAGIYFLMPFRTNFLVLGIDRSPEGTSLGRSDTNILVTIKPLRPYVGILSIPRDLWVVIPGVGENRINTAHFFAEGQEAGSGPYAALETVEQNFGVPVDFFVRIRFDGIVEVVDSMGGLDIELANSMAGLPPGEHHLSGEQALVFVRDRQGTDDFFRMQQGQFFITEVIEQLLQPRNWPRIPAVIGAINRSIDTNLPLWVWPRLGFALIRSGPGRIDHQVIGREMVSATTTSEGAQVLIPDWSLINPLIEGIFGQ
jgi:LCP family protein required for cell wall assembly